MEVTGEETDEDEDEENGKSGERDGGKGYKYTMKQRGDVCTPNLD
jgi:hypothetical protein